MWAMIPMFRVFSSVNLRGMGSLSSSTAVFVALPDARAKKRALRARYCCEEVGPEADGYVSRVSIRKAEPLPVTRAYCEGGLPPSDARL